MKYRTRVTIEALQWDGTEESMNHIMSVFTDMVVIYSDYGNNGRLVISYDPVLKEDDEDSEEVLVFKGDYIARKKMSNNSVLYSKCSNAIFNMLYEEVKE